jgi:hypothetical protein
MVVIAVVAGLLAMHTLTSAQLGISGSGHVHTDDHHGPEADAPVLGVASQALPAPAALPAAAGGSISVPAWSGALPTGQTRLNLVSANPARALPFAAQPAEPSTLVVAASSPAAGQSQQTGPGQVDHGLCPGATPGHCPHLPALMSLCQAILSGAGMMLLLLVLLALAVRRTAWTIRLALRSLSRAPYGEWSTGRYRLREVGPSLHELCISRT